MLTLTIQKASGTALLRMQKHCPHAKKTNKPPDFHGGRPQRKEEKHMKKLIAVALAAAVAVSLVACGRVQIDSISLPESQLLNKGDTIQLMPEFGSEKTQDTEKIAAASEKLTLEWSSSDENVATVDATGLVTAVAAGEADITAKIADTEISATCTVTVEVPVDGVTAPESLEFTEGEEGKALDAKINPEDATNVMLKYESSDEAVATVDENGVVTPVAAGECVIKTSVVSASDTNAEAEDKAVVVDAATEENVDATQAEPTSEDAAQVDATAEDAVPTEDSQDKPQDKPMEDVIASAETKVTVKAAEVKAEATNKTLNNKSTSTSSTSHAQPAPSQSGTTSTPSQTTTSTPSSSKSTPAPNPAPAPEPAPAPVPAPAPEPSTPSGDNTASDRADAGEIIEGGGTSEGNGEESTLLPD